MKTLLYIHLCVLLLSCKTQNMFDTKAQAGHNRQSKTDTVFKYDPGYQYRVRRDDKISLSVWGQDELSVGSTYGIYNSNEIYGKWLLVDVDGNVEIPRLGKVNVLGKSVIQLKDTLKTLFSKWLLNPIVDVKVQNKQITLLGELKVPGVISVDKDRNTLLEMIGRAGGLDPYANLKKIKVLRQEGPHVRMLNVDLTYEGDFTSQIVLLHPGDVVIVPSRNFKMFDKRISSLIPFTTTISAAVLLFRLF